MPTNVIIGCIQPDLTISLITPTGKRWLAYRQGGDRASFEMKIFRGCYCLERFLLTNPFNAQIWYKLSKEYGIYLNERYKNASVIYMKTAKSINPNIEKEM